MLCGMGSASIQLVSSASQLRDMQASSLESKLCYKRANFDNIL